MKKYYFILAAAALGFASCSNDETIESAALSESNVIGFNALTSGITRAADVNLTANGFKVTATKTSDASTVYFKNVDFTSSTPATTFASATKYYWPSDYNLDFYAYSPIATSVVGESKQIVPTSNGSAYDADAYSKFIVTPDATAANQVDLVYARTNNWGKADGAADGHVIPTADGVTINFRHTESKVLIKLYNSDSNIKVSVKDASICNVYTTGVFTFAASNTDTKDYALLDGTQWTGQATSGSYTVTDESNSKFNVASGSAAQVGSQDWILIPQTLTYATTYSGAEVGNGFNGACIKINLKIQNNAGSDAYIVGAASGENGGYVTAMWPLKSTPTAWVPGKMYTYTVDLAGGGYFPTNTAAGTGTALDPILDGAVIKFVSVTVDDWIAEDGSVYDAGL